MDEQPEMIRKEMDETKLQLAEKMETLELQIAESVQSTGMAVNATAEAIQVTAEAVTEVVQDAVQSVSQVFDFRRQIEGHPVIVFGGAIAFGYLAHNMLIPATKLLGPQLKNTSAQSHVVSNARFNEEHRANESRITTAAVQAASASAPRSPSWPRLKDVAIGSLTSIIQAVISRSVPLLVDHFIGPKDGTRGIGSESTSETANLRREHESMTEEKQRARKESSGKVRLVNSF